MASPCSARAGREILRWGLNGAQIKLEAELRGNGELPPIPSAIPVASRDGIDLDPVDLANPDQLLWLRTLKGMIRNSPFPATGTAQARRRR